MRWQRDGLTWLRAPWNGQHRMSGWRESCGRRHLHTRNGRFGFRSLGIATFGSSRRSSDSIFAMRNGRELLGIASIRNTTRQSQLAHGHASLTQVHSANIERRQCWFSAVDTEAPVGMAHVPSVSNSLKCLNNFEVFLYRVTVLIRLL